MTWFLRKSFRLGPLRLNLSKRGLGVSVGVTGARLGVDATGKPYAAGGRYGLYLRERLGARRARQSAPDLGGRGPGQPAAPSPAPPVAPQERGGPRWGWLVLLALLIGLVLGVLLARAGEPTRVDLFDTRGNRTGYAVVDPRTGRVDTYDARSNRTGWGRVDERTGTVDLFDLRGNRAGTGRIGRDPTPSRGGARAR